jgi:hypothetical protein
VCLEEKVAASSLEKRKFGIGICHADHMVPFFFFAKVGTNFAYKRRSLGRCFFLKIVFTVCISMQLKIKNEQYNNLLQ